MQNKEELYLRWQKLAARYCKDQILIESIYNEICKRYNEKTRFYHNLNHIHTILKEIDKHEASINKLDTILFATWFHDIIYNSFRKDNEEKSAECAKTILRKMKVNETLITDVSHLILKTKDHVMVSIEESFDCRLFIDCDLLILGAEQSLYVNYMNNVRKEYRYIPNFIYKKARLKVLKLFIGTESIFKTKILRERYELQARKNLEFEINLLTH